MHAGDPVGSGGMLHLLRKWAVWPALTESSEGHARVQIWCALQAAPTLPKTEQPRQVRQLSAMGCCLLASWLELRVLCFLFWYACLLRVFVSGYPLCAVLVGVGSWRGVAQKCGVAQPLLFSHLLNTVCDAAGWYALSCCASKSSNE